MYNQTKGSTLQSYIQDIKAKFQIDWMTTSWSDLRKPLHSALAARLYILQSSGGIDIPRSVSDQADFWKSYYRPGGDTDDFVVALEQLEQGIVHRDETLVDIYDLTVCYHPRGLDLDRLELHCVFQDASSLKDWTWCLYSMGLAVSIHETFGPFSSL